MPPRCIFRFPLGPAHSNTLVFGEPRARLIATSTDEVTAVLREAERHAHNGAWVAGYVSYDAAPAFDPAFRIPGQSALPPAGFWVFDHPLAGMPASGDGAYFAGDWALSVSRERYNTDIAAIRQSIADGEVYQINHTVRLHGRHAGDDRHWFADLCEGRPGEYCAYLDTGRHRILSFSPELLFRRDGSRITARPMKGTVRRGLTAEEDDQLAQWLAHSEKNRAENLMIVDLVRNDLSRIAMPHSVKTPQLFSVERFPTVFQMTSTVTAESRPGTTLEQLFTALFPCGSVTGAPKIKAMEIIARLETEPRGVYCGAIGLLAPGGNAVFSVAIRTVTLDAHSATSVFGTGGGIVWDSTAEDEYDELLLKARFLTQAAKPFSLLETLLLKTGHFVLIERHLQRLSRSARHFGYPFDEVKCREALDALAARFPTQAMRVRMTLSPEGVIDLETFALSAIAIEGGSIALASAPVSRGDAMLQHKTTQRALYDQALAAHAGVFDVLLWNEEGELTEFTRGNLVLDIEGGRYTPPLECGLLDGTLRRELLERGEVSTQVLRREDLARAERIWFINSVRGEVPVTLLPTAS